MAKIKVVIVDDHSLFRQGLQRILASFAQVDVVGSTVNGRAALEVVKQTKPDIVLMDLKMADGDGIEATRLIAEAYPRVRVVVLTASEDQQDLWQALRAGAEGYLLKNIEPEELYGYLQGLVRGEIALSGHMARKVIGEVVLREEDNKVTSSWGDHQALSHREREVLELVGRGLSNKEIAAELCLSISTVKNHIRRLMDKLLLKNRVQLALYAQQQDGGSTKGHN